MYSWVHISKPNQSGCSWLLLSLLGKEDQQPLMIGYTCARWFHSGNAELNNNSMFKDNASDKTGTIESQQLIDRKQLLRLIVGADHLLDIRLLQKKKRREGMGEREVCGQWSSWVNNWIWLRTVFRHARCLWWSTITTAWYLGTYLI